MPYGSPWSEQFVRQLSDKEVRSEFAADQIRARIALLIRSLREQSDRNWTQAELGERAGKPQNVISRFEDPNYGKMSLQSLFDLAAAFDLPVWIDMPKWEEWFALINDVPNQGTQGRFSTGMTVDVGMERLDFMRGARSLPPRGQQDLEADHLRAPCTASWKLTEGAGRQPLPVTGLREAPARRSL